MPSGGSSATSHCPEEKELTEGLPLALRRKLAVWAAAGGWLGMGRWPRAMPTIAVMWVSVPNTWMGIPVVFPVEVHKSSQSPQGKALQKLSRKQVEETRCKNKT